MSRFCGDLGFVTTSKSTDPDRPGSWDENVVRKKQSGTINKDRRVYVAGEGLINNLKPTTRISLIASTYILKNQKHLRFVEFNGNVWSIQSYEIEYPEIIITLGGLYNGKTN